MLQKLLIAVIAIYALCMAIHPFGHGDDAEKLPIVETSQYAGNYEIAPGEQARIVQQGSAHFLDLSDGVRLQLIPAEDHRFEFGNNSEGYVQFLVDERGEAVGFLMESARGTEFVAERADTQSIRLFGKVKIE